MTAMMRLASFFIFSVSLHAAALVYPVSFGGRSQASLIQVTILPIEQEGGRRRRSRREVEVPRAARRCEIASRYPARR